MPRSRIALWVLLLAWPSVSPAQQAGAITEYLKPIVSKIADDPNAGGWAWEINGNGGYLLRMEMDATGDGLPELFITTSLTTSNQIAEWTVFDVNHAGVMRPYGQSISLPADSVWPTGEASSPALLYVAAPAREREQASDEKPYPVYRFEFTFPEIKETLFYASREEIATLYSNEPGKHPRLQAILLADYLVNPDSIWSEVTDWKVDANGSFFRVEDKDRAKKNRAFTPQVALAQLSLLQTALQRGNDQTSPPPPVPPIRKKPSAMPEPKSPAAKGDSASSAPWPIMAVLIVAVSGLLLWLLKGRKHGGMGP